MTRERQLTVKIPAGIATGQRLRLYGEGEHGLQGGPPGDLYIIVHVKEHSFFRRDDDDLYCEIAVNFTTLVLGGTVKVPTLDGDEAVSIPEGTQSGASFAALARHAERVGPRPRRSPRLGEGRGAEEALEGSEEGGGGAGEGAARRSCRAGHARGRTREKPFFERVKDIFG